MFLLDLDSSTKGLVPLGLVMVPEARMSTAVSLVPILWGGRAHSWMAVQGRSTVPHRKKVDERRSHARSTENWKEIDIDPGRKMTRCRRLIDA